LASSSSHDLSFAINNKASIHIQKQKDASLELSLSPHDFRLRDGRNTKQNTKREEDTAKD
jgi:hypothetical protein